MDSNTPISCSRCEGSYTVLDLVERAEDWWRNVDVVRSTTPCCAAREEIRIEPGKVGRGYVYAAGGPHFCGMVEYVCPEISDRKDSEEGLSFSLRGEGRWVPAIKGKGKSRMPDTVPDESGD